MVDLDAEAGRRAPPAGTELKNTFRVSIKKTGTIHMAALDAYLRGQGPFDEHVLVAITFLDHLLRETPTKQYLSVKRSFFQKVSDGRMGLGMGIEAMKGVYQSIRPVQGGRLSINLDVAYV